jgi:hypothetical protein
MAAKIHTQPESWQPASARQNQLLRLLNPVPHRHPLPERVSSCINLHLTGSDEKPPQASHMVQRIEYWQQIAAGGI